MNTARTVRLSRRSLLAVGVGLGAGLIAGCQAQGAPPPQTAQPLTDSTDAQPVVTDRVLSPGRYREVDIVIIRPTGVRASLPVCVALHDRPGGAKAFLEYGLPAMLDKVVASGAPPFAVAAVDGGNWVGDKDDEPQRMLNQDLPGWLTYHDLASTPFAVIGVGEGASGAFNQAKNPGFAAVAMISPALFDSWADADKSKIFDDRGQWERSEPLRHSTELGNVPLGVWCGTEAPNIARARQLAERAKAAKASFTPGGHTPDYFKTALPEALAFAAEHL
ncbi:esterase [Actinokineospora auranticolor]|uniref:S-formylglutathione hydrolase FrmB n=1 Tax=Actinokineospora auranticolor TaxID=155976 RepID=A0A2S6GFF0_9PSEU|nr:esterase [Actinokineospora auranticolor]PPK63943.1 S-formylglutathione hydrolase FrmB [Actinokineospora auranticolor]